SRAIPDQKKVLWLLGTGTASLTLGILWAQQFPIIKLLWTSSYVLIACGCSALLLGSFHQIIEIWQCRKWAQPFVWLGMNAITIYIVASILNFRKLSGRLVGGDIAHFLGNYSDFVLALVTLTLVFCLVRFLYQRKVFLRL